MPNKIYVGLIIDTHVSHALLDHSEDNSTNLVGVGTVAGSLVAAVLVIILIALMVVLLVTLIIVRQRTLTFARYQNFE